METYNSDVDGDRWVLRDAAAEEPMVDAMGATLTDWQPVFNDVQEVVGLRLWFDDREVPIVLRAGRSAAEVAGVRSSR